MTLEPAGATLIARSKCVKILPRKSTPKKAPPKEEPGHPVSRRIEITVDREVASVFVRGQPEEAELEGGSSERNNELPGDFESLLRIASEVYTKK